MSDQSTENPLKKIVTSLNNEWKHRTKSNAIISFIISWILIEWKFVFYILFSSDTVNYKLASYSTDLEWYSVFYGLIGVVLYLAIFPFLDILFTVFSNWLNSGLNDIKLDQERDLRESVILNEILIEKSRNKLYEEMQSSGEIKTLNESNNFLLQRVSELESLSKNQKEMIDRLNQELEINETSKKEQLEYVKKSDREKYFMNIDRAENIIRNNPELVKKIVEYFKDSRSLHIENFKPEDYTDLFVNKLVRIHPENKNIIELSGVGQLIYDMIESI